MNLQPEQSRRYFEARLKGQRWGSGAEVKAKCLFHDDRNPSLGVNLEKGVWKCHAGCGEGGLLDFEMKFSRCNRETAKTNIAGLLGDTSAFSQSQTPEAIYQYRDAQGRLVFEKLRYPGKLFVHRKQVGKGGYEYKF